MAQIEMIKIKEVDLLKLCEKSKITMKKLSDETGISYTYLSKLNNNVLTIKPKRWEEIKRVLDKYK
jgi:DNA-binding Xre family transcriptional regulator